MKIGLFGGTFDPVHMGHMILAETVRSDLDLDRVLFIPASVSPHKTHHPITEAAVRLEMLRAATGPVDGLDVSDKEIQRGGISYTVDTIEEFLKDGVYRNMEICFLIGCDSLIDLDSWKDPERLLGLVSIVVMERPGYDRMTARRSFRDRVRFVETPLIDISASEIRRRVREGKSIRFWVPEPVIPIIRERGLYR